MNYHVEVRLALALLVTLPLGACGGGGGGSSAPAPTVSLTASATSVVLSSLVTLTWSSTNATSCTASGSWAGAKAMSGSESVGPLNADASYTLSCSGAGGFAHQAASVTVTQPISLSIISGTPPDGTVGVIYNPGDGVTCAPLASGGCGQCFISASDRVCPDDWRYENSFFFRAAGGTPPYTWTAVSLPPDLILFANGSLRGPTGFRQGKPSVAGTYPLTVTVTDSGSPATQVRATYTVVINSAPPATNARTTPSVGAINVPHGSVVTQASVVSAANSAKLSVVTTNPSPPIFTATSPPTAYQDGKNSRYVLKDLGASNGPNSYVQDTPKPINNAGTVVGIADTSFSDPFQPFCFYDCFLVHAFQWRRGVLTDLGALVSGVSSAANAVNASGVVTGLSETGAMDSTATFPEFHAVIWKNAEIIDLGTLGGTSSYAADINDRGQVVGFALNGQDAVIPDDNDFAAECGAGPMPSEMQAFIWQEGRGMRPLGTLGGPESCARYINQRGEITGLSFTSYTPNVVTGIPAFEPFIWANGKMIGLGSLGGTQGHPSGINNQGQVAGDSNLAGDEIGHAFFWDHGEMTDVAPETDFAVAEALNDLGEVVGGAHDPGDQPGFAYLWQRGRLTYLGACSVALSINSKTQIVGQAIECPGDGSHAFLWEDGGPAIDLNTLVPPHSGLTLTTAIRISDDGEIVAQGVLANGDVHAFLLIPRNRER